MVLALVIALACAQRPTAPTSDSEAAYRRLVLAQRELAALDWDTLIERISPVEIEREWSDGGARPDLVVDEVSARLARGELPSDVQWRRMLIRSEAVSWRRSWWSELDFAFRLQAPGWLDGLRLRMTPRAEGLPAAHVELPDPLASESGCGMGPPLSISSSRRSGNVGWLSAGTHALAYNVTIERRSDRRVLWSGEIVLDVEVVDEPALASHADRSVGTSRLVRDSLRVEFDDASRERRPLLVLRPTDELDASSEAVLLDLSVDVLHDGDVVDHFELREQLTSGSRTRGSPAKIGAARRLDPIPSAAECDPDASRGWAVQMTGRAEAALREPRAVSWWDGNVTISLDDLLVERSR